MTARSLLRVLMFHRVGDPHQTHWLNPGLVSATPEVFERIAALLAREYAVITMDDAVEAVAGARRLPARAVLITFDDGYQDFGTTAWPILKRFRLPVTLFVPTAYAGGEVREFWWDRLYRAMRSAPFDRLEDTPVGPLRFDTPDRLRRAARRLQSYFKSLPHGEAMQGVDRLCGALQCSSPATRSTLTWAELRALAQEGVTLAPHTRTHPLLTRVSAAQVREEIVASREDLRRELGACPPVFAYPAGAHSSSVQEILRDEGFQLAFTTIGGHNPLPGADPLRLRRTNITPRTTQALLRMRLSEWAGAFDRWRHGHRGDCEQAPTMPPGKVAYVMSRFPKLSETFVLNEIRTVEQLGLRTEIYPLMRERQRVVHEEAAPLVARAHFQPILSIAVVLANIGMLVRRPLAYLSIWWEALRGTWGSLNFFAGALAFLPKSVWMARRMERDGICHLHAHFANHPALAAFVVHRLTGIPFSFTAHGSDLHVDRHMLPQKVAAASFVVAISQFNKAMIVEECRGRHAEKVHVVHCGVDPEWFGERRAAMADRSRLHIVCVGSLELIKGHRYLIQACEQLRARGIDFTCHLVGDGPLRNEVARQIARSGLQEYVILHGPRTRQQVAAMVARCDVAVLASAPTPRGKREGIPVALMEAMSAGLPVVATRTGGIPELVDDGRNGFLVPPADAAALTDALQRLASDPELRERLGRTGRATILREFDQEQCAEHLVRLMQRYSGRIGVSSTEMTASHDYTVGVVRPAVTE